ncbi:gluconokinase [Candidatus Woesearchaeota archaeon]|nr:gluconokinase [Candidatus Woesearchaeota archaeon]
MDLSLLREALQKQETYPHDIEEVKVITTAVSIVFLTGEIVYKINKPMNLGFLDFSSLEKRKDQCEKEVVHNSLISPRIYLGVSAITKEFDGSLKVDGKGEVVEYAVRMNQVDPESTMDKRLAAEKVTEENIKVLAKKIYDFHQIAPMGEDINEFGSVETIQFNWNENFEQTQSYKDLLISSEDFSFTQQKVNAFIENNRGLFESRITKNKIKHCHGDFHPSNVFMTNEDSQIFDGIVFNKRFPCSDVIAEIAFMTMDLDFHGQDELAKIFLQEYISLSNDGDIKTLIDFYNCYRSYIRGKISAFTYDDQNISIEEKEEMKQKAEKYFNLSKHYAGRL